MNSHYKTRFIYITPYIQEASRIANACIPLKFVEPTDKDPAFQNRKSDHIASLIREGRNIATTHQSFSRMSDDTLKMISEQRYTLIIDEAVDMIASVHASSKDISDAVRLGYITQNDSGLSLTGATHYDGGVFKKLMEIFQCGRVFRYNDKTKDLYFWTLPHDLITAFENVFILTYLFEGQALSQFLKLNNIKYDYIGVERSSNGVYSFSTNIVWKPDWIGSINKLIHIIDKPKMNAIGDNRCDLSWHWFKRHAKDSPQIETIRRNLNNYFYNLCPDSIPHTRLCGCSTEGMEKISGKGYAKSIIAFNTRATNQYSSCKYLAYIMNVFFNPNMSQFFNDHGLSIDENVYALSTMLQWIWRSAIRNGEPITLYVPSRRMRGLLQDWIATISA